MSRRLVGSRACGGAVVAPVAAANAPYWPTVTSVAIISNADSVTSWRGRSLPRQAASFGDAPHLERPGRHRYPRQLDLLGRSRRDSQPQEDERCCRTGPDAAVLRCPGGGDRSRAAKERPRAHRGPHPLTAIPVTSKRAPNSSVPEPRKARAGGAALKYSRYTLVEGAVERDVRAEDLHADEVVHRHVRLGDSTAWMPSRTLRASCSAVAGGRPVAGSIPSLPRDVERVAGQHRVAERRGRGPTGQVDRARRRVLRRAHRRRDA